jgi:hypothetical protein
MPCLGLAAWIFQSSGKFSPLRAPFWTGKIAERISPAAVPASRAATDFAHQMKAGTAG